MISLKYNFVFLHVPKSSGNSIQSILLPFSDDAKVFRQHQDGVERFNVKGPITPNKHADLQSYAGQLKERGMVIAIPYRDPAERLISYYFSPHRWFAQEGDDWVQQPAFWDRDRFAHSAAEVRPAIEFLTLNGATVQPDHILRFDQLQTDFERFIDAIGVAPPSRMLPHLNATQAPPEEVSKARSDPIVAELARRRFGEDYRFFGQAEQLR